MKINSSNLIFLWAFLILALFVNSMESRAGTVHYFNSKGNKSAAVADSFEQQMQCIADSLQQKGYRPNGIYCYGIRPSNKSAHPNGQACDVDQTARNVTRQNKWFSPSIQIQIAANCKGVSGCKWRRPDCGHYEKKSAQYARKGACPQVSYVSCRCLRNYYYYGRGKKCQ